MLSLVEECCRHPGGFHNAKTTECNIAKRKQTTVKTSNPTQDAGRVKLGGLSPNLRPARIADSGIVRLGGLSPAL